MSKRLFYALNTTTPEAPVPTIHYELTNHLGNVMAVITDEPAATETPAVESLADYYPFGMTLLGRSYNAHTSRHGFTGHEKESDLSEGIYTTEYRLYDARVGRWLSVDPLFEKYVGMSPYNYCMLNPVMLVDPDGEDVVICDGEEHFLYEPQTSNLYDGNNVVIKNSVAVLNDMYSTKSGSKVLNALISSPTEYKIKSTGDAYSKGYAVSKGNEVDFGGIFELNTFSHELFHQYQRENNQGGATYFNEVEAYTFEKFVVTEYNDNLSDEELINGLFKQSNYFDDSLPNSTNSNEYENAAKNIIVNGIFNKSNFEITVKLFKNNSNANNSGLYSQPHYKERTENEKRYLLESIFSK